MTGQYDNDLIFYNNKFIQHNHPCILVNDRGLSLGDGVFETILSYKNKIPFFKQHWQRLLNALYVLKINISDYYSKDYIYSVLIDLLSKNYTSSQTRGIKIIITRGVGPRSVEPVKDLEYSPNIIIHCFDVNPDTLKSLNSRKLIVSNIKVNQTSPLSKIKSLNYLDRVIAKQQAVNNHFDDALLVNFNNDICSASTSNIFFILQDDTVITPLISDGILPGITRQYVINILQENNYVINQQSINLEYYLYTNRFKAAFITNSIQGIREVNQINEIKLISHDTTKYLHDKYLEEVTY